MLLAGVLPWMLRAVFSAPEPSLVHPPATAVSLADEQREAAEERTPTAGEHMAGPPPAATALPQVAGRPTALGARLLVERWLVRHCEGIEERYQQRGQEQWRCSWHDVHISGSLPTVEVEFTRIDRALEEGRGASLELMAREQIRLKCADETCRRLTSVPGTSREVVAMQSGVATPTEHVGSRPHPNSPPTVEILVAPQRVSPGERVVLESRVTDPDSSRGDEVECTWSVDRRPVSRLCWQLVWNVPVAEKYGNVIFTLIARDRRGASGSKSVSVFVGPSERATD